LSIIKLDKGSKGLWHQGNNEFKNKEYDFQTKHFIESVEAKIIEVKEVRQNNADGSTLNFVINLEGTGIEYKTAQNLAVFVKNSSDDVAELGKYFNISDLDDVLELKYVAPEGSTRPFKFPFPSPITFREVFTSFCDINGQVM
jgi:sulfite reductase alpha subunit-like flavoprotein